ncbi:hypothetical protein FSP39_008611 [Pinctada imbricata]|uniref:Endoglucanase n=1 Tax=Pinctada imbricata TaxID=66713 RepID=A0AA89C1D1_PINIB|nr:hypothetical protein FSP39_008611 [Pinctada imbricata]
MHTPTALLIPRMMFVIVTITAIIAGCHGDGIVVQMSNINDWGGGRFEGHFVFPLQNEDLEGWEVILTFDAAVTGISEWMGDIIKTSQDNKVYVLVNKPHDGIQQKGTTLDITVQGTSASGKAPSATGKLVNMGHDGFTVSPLPDNDTTKYNYNDVLHKSIMFYEAQRSGKLPADNEILWRGDSALNDKGNNGEDLTGGWYDAGDNVKFAFPMSASTTLLGWGLLQYKDAYQAAGLLDKMYDCIRWPLEWMLKCHTGPNELYVQVGDGAKDHAVWDRPESMTMARPAFKVDAQNPGSDVAGEYAAAMAVGYLVFKDKDPAFAQTLLNHSIQLNTFAVTYKGKYSDSVNAAAAYYRSTIYQDELSWAGAWLYKVTNDSKYLQQAELYYQNGSSWGQSWDDKSAGAMILLYNMTGKDKYKQDIEATFHDWMPGGTIPYSPKGLAFRSQVGITPICIHARFGYLTLVSDPKSKRCNVAKKCKNYYVQDVPKDVAGWVGYDASGPTFKKFQEILMTEIFECVEETANMAFMALLAADTTGLHADDYRKWAMSQIHYALGDAGRSFVCGFGTTPPTQPHHRGASCPSMPAPCGWAFQQSKAPNPHVLYGALVGGPDGSDSYTDDRNNYISNEVACDYNAGFQSAVAGILYTYFVFFSLFYIAVSLRECMFFLFVLFVCFFFFGGGGVSNLMIHVIQ